MAQAHIGKIIQIDAIENADRIEQATVVCGAGGKWKGVTVKGQFGVGDLCEVYLQDSIMPDTERFAFLKSKTIRIAKLRGAYSECLIMPLTVDGNVGYDISFQMGVTKYTKPLPLSADIKGNFPIFIPKTDEPNFQTVPELVKALCGKPAYVTQKMDGTSITIYNQDGWHICSRNYEIADTGLFDPYKTFPEGYAIQMEFVGDGIQSNPAGISGKRGFVFNVYEIEKRRYLNYVEAMDFALQYRLDFVNTICTFHSFDADETALRNLSVGKYANGKAQEGIVVRPTIEQQVETSEGWKRLSFKVINAEYKG